MSDSIGMPCLFHLLTGFYCPGCGGTRAVRALLTGHPLLSLLYHPLVPYCGAVAAWFALSYLLYWITGRERFRLYLDLKYVYTGVGIVAVNFFVKNGALLFAGIDLLERLPRV